MLVPGLGIKIEDAIAIIITIKVIATKLSCGLGIDFTSVSDRVSEKGRAENFPTEK